MARNTFLSWDTTDSNNTDVGGNNIAEGCPPSSINNAIRNMMAQLRIGVDGNTIYASKSGNYTALATDNNAVHRYTATATVALTAAATLAANWHYTVVADGAAVTIDPNGSETINGLLTLTIPNGATATIICDGSNFFTVIRTSAWVPIGAPIVLSGQTVVDWTDLGSYSHLRLTIDYTPSAVSGPFLRVSTDNGATFLSGASGYYFSALAQGGATVAGVAQTFTSSMALSAGNSNAVQSSTTIELSYFNKATGCLFRSDIFRTTTAPIPTREFMYGAEVGTTARNALRLGTSAGNFASGIAILEGIRG